MSDFASRKERRKKEKNSMRELLESVIIAVIMALIIRTFLFQFFWIPSRSMEETLLIKDRIVVSRFTYHFQEPERGDIIVFKYPLDPKTDFVKRLVGLPGEKIEFVGGNLYVNDLLINEDYLGENTYTHDFGPVEVPQGSYFLLGDNRGNSSDSRVWGFVSKELIKGKAQVIYWPLDRMGRIK